ncbi:MAG: hypothetical protein Phog2KO_34160 [Phototrophicaceae bacterium]
MPRYYSLILVILLTACLPQSAPIEPARDIEVQERVLNETFTTQGNWSSYNTDMLSINVIDGVYRLLSTQRNQYIWGTNNIDYTNTIIDVDVRWLSDSPYTFAGVVCRLHPENGQGYYVVVSADGDFSIRYIGQNIDDGIVRWRNHPDIPTSGSFRMRVACVDDFIALYIDGIYIDGGEDSRLSDGAIGLTLGLPDIASANNGGVEFDNLRVWEANFP